jgi:hypothetical protein
VAACVAAQDASSAVFVESTDRETSPNDRINEMRRRIRERKVVDKRDSRTCVLGERYDAR